ncbi:hypothetical protein [uncultured Negativibacillus sp.]|uniref:hypothetical protein n=1 Tax=uncultured Negativibacillus sp. TaxID=1980696 RepID=UPI0026005D1B|nr:hypothetical protein [uncultured Negativibacillus sp.]
MNLFFANFGKHLLCLHHQLQQITERHRPQPKKISVQHDRKADGRFFEQQGGGMV